MKRHVGSVPGVNPCAGCCVCAAACPAGAIRMARDADGFLRPLVDEAACTGCGRCLAVCYRFLEAGRGGDDPFAASRIHAAWSRRPELVAACSSGGVAAELAEHHLAAGGDVYGCLYDGAADEFRHAVAAGAEDLARMRTSKYGQSRADEAFRRLAAGRGGLVVGTPCQVHGLRRWLGDGADGRAPLLVDFFCNGTPALTLWRKYAAHAARRAGLRRPFREVNFRSKRGTGWHAFAMRIGDGERAHDVADAPARDLFFRLYLGKACHAPACYGCRLRRGAVASDLRLADFWGERFAANETGVSLVVVNTPRGAAALEALSPRLHLEPAGRDDLDASQPHERFPVPPHRALALALLRGPLPLPAVERLLAAARFAHRVAGFLRRRLGGGRG